MYEKNDIKTSQRGQNIVHFSANKRQTSAHIHTNILYPN